MLQTQQVSEQYPNYQILDEEGFLIDPSDWDRAFTARLAAQMSVDLSEKHWELIGFLRDKYLRLGALPPMRTVCKSVGIRKLEIIRRFGSCLTLWQMAGLPNPGEEAKAYMN